MNDHIETIYVGEQPGNSEKVIKHYQLGNRVLFPEDTLVPGGIVAVVYKRGTRNGTIKNHLINEIYCDTYEETDFILSNELKDAKAFLEHFDTVMEPGILDPIKQMFYNRLKAIKEATEEVCKSYVFYGPADVEVNIVISNPTAIAKIITENEIRNTQHESKD